MSADDLWASIETMLGIDLTPPIHVGGYLGIRAGACILQMRILEAVYAAYRLRQLARDRRVAGRICEIGAGAGLTAYYAARLGLPSYVIVDLPTMNAVQGYMLAGSRIGETVALSGEPESGRTVRILPPEAFAGLPADSIDILYNQDSLPEIEVGAARAYLRSAADLRIPLFLSINQEAHLATSEGRQATVPELVAGVGRHRASSRHRH